MFPGEHAWFAPNWRSDGAPGPSQVECVAHSDDLNRSSYGEALALSSADSPGRLRPKGRCLLRPSHDSTAFPDTATFPPQGYEALQASDQARVKADIQALHQELSALLAVIAG